MPSTRRLAPFAWSLLIVSAGCVGIGSGDDGPLDPGAMDAALNELGDDVTDGEVRAVFTEDCPLIDGDDLIDALVDAEVLDRQAVRDADSEVTSTVRGPWGSFSVECQHPTFSLAVRNGGPNDRNELIDVAESSVESGGRWFSPVAIDGLDESRTYEIRQDGDTVGVGWIEDETAVEVSVRSGIDTADDDRLATALVTVLGLLDDRYGDTAPIDRPDEPPVDLADVRDRVRGLGDDVDDLSRGERLDDCPIAAIDDVDDLLDEVGIDTADLVVREGFIFGTNGTPNVAIQCAFGAGDAAVSVSVGLVDFDGLDELEQVLGGSATDAIDRTIDVESQVERLPDDAVFSIRDGDDVVGVGVLSGEVQITMTVARGDVDTDELLTVLPALVDLVTGALG